VHNKEGKKLDWKRFQEENEYAAISGDDERRTFAGKKEPGGSL
jgi:hypothetical protein